MQLTELFETAVLLLLLTVGIWLTICMRGMPFRHPMGILKETIGSVLKPTGKKGRFSSFAAAATSLAGTMGTGNIVGVSTAIAAGGAGAVFWMIVGALFGMCTKYAEILLGFRYRKKVVNGEYRGGPMYYLSDGLGWKTGAKTFAVLCALCGLGAGNLTQVNAAVQSVQSAADGMIPGWLIGAGMGCICLVILSGGTGWIGRFASVLMPVLSVGYLAGCAGIIWLCREDLGDVISEILCGAFGFRPLAGGCAGVWMIRAMRFGLARGVFSHEAGLGSAPIVHAEASEADPHVQGLWGAFEVFWDTVVGCGATALVILLAAHRCEGNSVGITDAFRMEEVFAMWFGNTGRLFVAGSLVLFALGAMVSWWMYGCRSMEYLSEGNSVGQKGYLAVFLSCAVLGGVIRSETVWEITDLLNCCMALPNLLAVFWLFDQRGDPMKKEKRR